MKRKRLLLLLALLMTAATGAWAQDAKHRITATLNFNSQTKQKTLDVTLPYETTIGAVYTAVTGMAPTPGLSLTAAEVTSGTNVSIGDFDEWNTPVNATADGDATVGFTATLMGTEINGTITLRVASPYEVKLAVGTEDAGNWTATVGQVADQELPANVFKGDAVTLTYGGRLKVKNVTATHDGWDGDLSNIPASLIQADGKTVIVPDGTTLTGTLNGETQPYMITIAADATVTLDGVTIIGVNNVSYMWAGLNCLGNATIVLKDGTTNMVRGFYMLYPGIHVPAGSTLTITGGTEGTGKLTASPFDGGTDDSYGAGIGGGYTTSCGDIDIQGGVITATGGIWCAGIGGGCNQPCGNISIEGGTVTATGGHDAAGIGGGLNASCGNITIASTVTRVTATKGDAAPHSIGAGNRGTCGTVTIGGTVYWQDNAAVDEAAATYLAQATIVYPSPFANVTPADRGKMIGSDGKVYNPDAIPAGTTAVAMIVYVGEPGSADAISSTYKGLALALDEGGIAGAVWGDAGLGTCLPTQYSESNKRTDMNGIANTNTLVSTDHSEHSHYAAKAARGYNEGKHPAGTSEWFLPSTGQWNIILDADGGAVNPILTSSSITGYTPLTTGYWTSTEASGNNAYYYKFDTGATLDVKNNSNHPIRACIAF